MTVREYLHRVIFHRHDWEPWPSAPWYRCQRCGKITDSTPASVLREDLR